MYPQPSYQLLERTNNLIKYHVEFAENNVLLKNNLSKNKFNYINEAEPGSPILNENTLFIAIPPGQKVLPVLVNTKVKIYDKFTPQINPKIIFNDSIYTYQNVDLDKKYFKGDYYPNSDIEVQGYLWIRDIYCCAVKINLFKYNWKKSQLSEITSGDLVLNYLGNSPAIPRTEGSSNNNNDHLLKEIIFNYKDAYNYVSPRNLNIKNNSDTWIDYNQEYYKLSIPEDGIYRITYDDLIKYRINPLLIDPQTVKIFWKGKQIPLFISGENDGLFNNEDYIEFWAEKNYGSKNYRNQVAIGEDYLNYYDRYTDTTFVWLTFNGEKGLRIKSQDSQLSSTADTINSQIVKLHFEEDKKISYYDGESPRTQLPFWQENKNWIWMESWELGTKKAFGFYAFDIIPNSKITTYARAISYAAPISQPVNNHNIGVSINSNSQVSSLLFNKNQTITLKSEFSSSLLNQGFNNIYIHNIPTGLTPNTFLLDWFDIEYARILSVNYNNSKFANDSIYFSINDSIDHVIKSIKISKITNDNFVLYKVNPEIKKFTNLKLTAGTLKNLVFSDTLAFGNAFYFTKESLIKHPKFIYKKIFRNVRNNQEGTDYLIISNKLLKNSVDLYKDFISQTYKLRTEVYYVDDIFDEFNFGYKDPKAIKDFLYYAYNNWKNPKLSYLFLIGEANYDYKNKWAITPKEKIPDLVTAFGYPVSDNWYVCFDSLNINIPQLYVGRIPASNDTQVLYYLNKHKDYLSRQYDSWNKRILLFSGGYVERPGETESLKAANEIVRQEFINSELGAAVKHFYKTKDPLSNFGPFPYEVVKNAIDSGAIYISYLGHSGTKTWDNGINSVDQLRNIANGNPLMTDFGCSTGKFAEPDIQSFSELFVNNNDGQAIGYFGNSSLGFLSIANSFPPIFANSLLDTSSFSLGQIHFLSKMKLFQGNGGFSNDVNRVFNYCNILIGDPIIKPKFPEKPNLFIPKSSISILEKSTSDDMDYITLQFKLFNDGKVSNDSITVDIIDEYNNNQVFNKKIKYKCPVIFDSVKVKIPIYKLPGQHNITIVIDSQNDVDEYNENDNTINYSFLVFSSNIRIVEAEKIYNNLKKKLIVLNPTIKNNTSNELEFAIDTTSTFSNSREYYAQSDSVYTQLYLPDLLPHKRYWWRVKSQGLDDNWSDVHSFFSGNNNYTWLFSEPLTQIQSENLNYNINNKRWELTSRQNKLRILSAGYYDGSTAIIEYNGEDKVGENLWGLATAILDSITLEPIKVVLFRSGGNSLVDSLASYINHLPNGTVIAMAIGVEARNYMLSSNVNSASRNAIKSLGSRFIDQVGYRESWCIIGKKGAAIGSVPEVYRKTLEGQAETDTTLSVKYSKGQISSPEISNVKSWDSLETSYNGKINYYLIGKNNIGITDTLGPLNTKNISLEELNRKHFSNLKLVFNFQTDSMKNGSTLDYVAVKYLSNPELTTNYQAVSVSKDSLIQGDSLRLNFSVFNVGESSADSFKVKVNLIKPDNSSKLLLDTLVARLDSMQRKSFSLLYKTSYDDGIGNMKFKISIDTDNHLTELFEDNNNYEIPFRVKPDTTPTSVTSASVGVTFDGINIVDGDYVSSNPEISITLSYPVWFPVYDSTAIKFYMDNLRINNSMIDIYPDVINRKTTFTYKPVLINGEHHFEIYGQNIVGILDYSPGYKVDFNVSNELKMMNVYNYPNPFKNNTNFTFVLTQVPDDIKIRIYTVAGRLIKEINGSSYPIHTGFNSIQWDGKDADGNFAANGTYIYKMIVRKEGKMQNCIQKLAIIR